MKLTSKSVDVVVKEEKEEDRVWGVAYCVSREEIEQIFDYLLLFLLFIFLNQHSLFTLILKKEITGTSLLYFCNPQSPKKSFLLKKKQKKNTVISNHHPFFQEGIKIPIFLEINLTFTFCFPKPFLQAL